MVYNLHDAIYDLHEVVNYFTWSGELFTWCGELFTWCGILFYKGLIYMESIDIRSIDMSVYNGHVSLSGIDLSIERSMVKENIF